MQGATCPLCESTKLSPFKSNSYFFPSASADANFNDFNLNICTDCNVVFMVNPPSDQAYAQYYNNQYRDCEFTMNLGGKKISPPIEIPWSGFSLLRYENFYNIIKSTLGQESLFSEGEFAVDYGGYQGMFGMALKQTLGMDVCVYDYNESGINFAKNVFELENSQLASDIYKDKFDRKAKLVTLIHVFEHLRDPKKFLQHLTNTVMDSEGYLYIEVPNVSGYPTSDPTHIFNFSPYSLEKLLNENGFEVKELRVSGAPHVGMEIDNDVMNIQCLAKRNTGSNVPRVKYSSHNPNFEMELQKSYFRLSLLATARELKIGLKRLGKGLYYGLALVGCYLFGQKSFMGGKEQLKRKLCQ